MTAQTIPGPRPLASGRFLMAGGGTGGHVIPALAVARELRKRGHGVFFVGTDRGLEAKLVPADGFELKRIEVGALNRVSLQRKLKTAVQLPLTTLGCGRFVQSASAIFSMGGYVAGPPVMAALLRRVPVVVMEPNAVPGFTNRVIGRWVARALISFPETANHFPRGRSELTGLPVRDDFFAIPPKPRGNVLNLLVTGGSQGSRTLNAAGRQSWPLFRKAGLAVRIVHQTGAAGFEEWRTEFARSGLEGEVVPFIQNMPAAFREADLVVCRSGAGAVSELAAAGKPSILVPFPFAADDHQTRNAEAFESAGASRLLRDAETTGESLAAAVTSLAADSAALLRMAAAAKQLSRPGAAARAADILEEVARDFN
ncbi:MAG TPA: undecaprenyldiphospho-muramoylpentapeptide beta-N-acetylglucosaminyltransferase [Bryobacteraceae bacterium]|jgi:UDP-N-acetylglucosamine--N-acetylmuramyl-(pentapeptide) pyrophosphoryl-undecaprenol N-acetylglucosamine transferase